MQTYMLVTNPADARFSHQRLEAFIANHRDVDSWVTLFRGCFFIRSDKDATGIKESLADFLDGDAFVVTQLNPVTTGGALSHEVWDWFNAPYLSPEQIEEFHRSRDAKALESSRRET